MPTRPPARDRLLTAADAVLFERGVRTTPVDELLRQADVSPATMYAHFGSKEALVAEALRRRLSRWQQVWDAHVLAADDDVSRLLALFDALAAYREERTARWCAFLATAAEHLEEGEVADVVTADTALLSERLLHLARPVAGARAQELADEVLLAYTGTLASFLRGTPDSAITVGRRLAESAARAHLVDPASTTGS
ncbi:transcriptional regulator, TetR family [Georgenia satyanarayanai]|uniref:Transcriptional regulator, TetR family n=1 Tax=Georgenia satyanarayanai TaxID=860221 RepID=A0A2Y9APK2_9MICO|nr:TetR/AcrR family transcriptional regulator [Georgenia satyanarayanai]PYF97238.1 TetR family transcriptional regulator [Georgenia satyanarayanai]SSA46324.1 transcriptional regulator, TetR family [Georgenia satyanarayanai]